jgi:hypothetical protein
MKNPGTTIRTVVALLIVTAASQVATAAASALHFAPVSVWPNSEWFSDQEGSALAVAGGYAYVARTDGEVRISNVSNPTNPVAVSTLTLTNNQRPIEVMVSGQHLYVRYSARSSNTTVWPSGGLQIFNVGNPTNPVHAVNYDPGHGLSALEVAGSYAYLAYYNTNVSPTETGLRLLDVSNPAQPVSAGVYTNAGRVNGMAVRSNRVYLANSAGLQILDVSNAQQPTLLGGFQTLEGAYDVAVAGNYAYMVTGRDAEFTADAGLEIIDVSDPAQPQRAGIHRTIFPLARVLAHERFAYVISDMDPAWHGKGIPAGRIVHVFDVTDPANVLQVDKNDLSGTTFLTWLWSTATSSDLTQCICRVVFSLPSTASRWCQGLVRRLAWSEITVSILRSSGRSIPVRS